MPAGVNVYRWIRWHWWNSTIGVEMSFKISLIDCRLSMYWFDDGVCVCVCMCMYVCVILHRYWYQSDKHMQKMLTLRLCFPFSFHSLVTTSLFLQHKKLFIKTVYNMFPLSTNCCFHLYNLIFEKCYCKSC